MLLLDQVVGSNTSACVDLDGCVSFVLMMEMVNTLLMKIHGQ